MKKQYTSYKETIKFLQQCAQQHPDLIKVESIGETWEKRPIMMATISFDVCNAKQKPALLYTGTIHAREWIGIELANSFIQYIIDNYQFNPKLQRALSRNTLYIVPCLNPDGFEYSRTHFSFWRKNRRDNGDGSFGVDLNRNFSVRFKKQSDKSSNIYGGPEAFSEPETKAIKKFVENHENITVALDYHSQGNVFFPAHKFNHEAEIDTTDLNTLCANMAHEIKKVTGRKYGIHRGKPPTNLINGSGREFYYSRGIIATVVEVGTRNIPDYMENMTQSVNENIPALVFALDCAVNYSSAAPARVDSFTIKELSCDEITLEWQWPEEKDGEDIYFEIYRSTQHKTPSTDDNLVGVTKSLTFTDVQLSSGRYYHYKIRAVNKNNDVKGPFAPELTVKTKLANDEFSRTIFPAKTRIGYVGEYTQEKNREHFGNNSLFIGVSESRGICYGVIEFPLDMLPDDLNIKDASFALYPMNRVSAKIEQYGEWGISFLDSDSVADISDYQQIKDARVIHRGQAIESDKVTQGVWSIWSFNGAERKLLKSQIKNGKLLIRIDGPKKLPRGHDSQMMQFDIGFGRFGSG
ncbi:MAG: M14 family zinc carboxypeptidase, partial [Psychromonas sp.]|nr:M14 family zinc carboxypeptidase [Psychromonas sp.]